MSVEWGGKRPSPIDCLSFLCYLIIPIGVLIVLAVVFQIWEIIIVMVLIVILGGSLYLYYKYYHQPKRVKEKKDYMNPDWLKHQYYDLGRKLQNIANEQNVSMFTIKKWVDKLDDDNKDLDASE